MPTGSSQETRSLGVWSCHDDAVTAAIRDQSVSLTGALFTWTWASSVVFHLYAQPGVLTQITERPLVALQTAAVLATALWAAAVPTSRRVNGMMATSRMISNICPQKLSASKMIL